MKLSYVLAGLILVVLGFVLYQVEVPWITFEEGVVFPAPQITRLRLLAFLAYTLWFIGAVAIISGFFESYGARFYLSLLTLLSLFALILLKII